jgi:transcriptional regulator with XRE-family HTH domain
VLAVERSEAGSFGERIRFHRAASRKTQAVVAGLAGISEDYLSQVERGLKVPSFGTLQRIADVLRVPAASLLNGQPKPVAADLGAGTPALRRAMTAPWLNTPSVPRHDTAHLGLWVDRAWSRWQGSPSRYTDTAALLPGLVRDIEAATSGRYDGEEGEARRLCEIAADLYFLLRSFCRRTGQLDLTLVAADRGLRLAVEAGDPLRVAAARWNLCHALLAKDEPDSARSVALDAANRLTGHLSKAPEDDGIALLGALYLVAAESSARCGDSDSARINLQEAGGAASVVGERNVYWTAFGPTNVAIHAVNVELHLGQVRSALAAAEDVRTERTTSIERRLTFLLELAVCHEHRSEDEAVLDYLLQAERTATEDLRHNAVAHELVGGLMTRARRSSAPTIKRLADRMGMVPA